MRFLITIWKWQRKLHEKEYQFSTRSQADAFSRGLYEGYRLLNERPTGYQTKEVESLTEKT